MVNIVDYVDFVILFTTLIVVTVFLSLLQFLLLYEERLGIVRIRFAEFFNIKVGLSKIACVENPKHLQGLADSGKFVTLRPFYAKEGFIGIVEIAHCEIVKTLDVHRHRISSLVKAFVKAKPDSFELGKPAQASIPVGY